MTVATKLTAEDLAELPEDGKRYELVEGELVGSPAPGTGHQHAVLKIGVLLDKAAQSGYGLAFVAPVEVYFDPYNVTQPDALFIRTDRVHIVKEQRVEGAPDLVVEVFSPSTQRRDRRVKLQIHERFGVSFYWLVDTVERTVQPSELVDQHYVARPLLNVGDTLTCALFPDITTIVGQLFR